MGVGDTPKHGLTGFVRDHDHRISARLSSTVARHLI